MPTTEVINDLIINLKMSCPSYVHFRIIDGQAHCLCPFLFTWAILGELTLWGYERRWCYGTYKDALKAYESWDGQINTEPTGYERRIG